MMRLNSSRVPSFMKRGGLILELSIRMMVFSDCFISRRLMLSSWDELVVMMPSGVMLGKPRKAVLKYISPNKSMV